MTNKKLTAGQKKTLHQKLMKVRIMLARVEGAINKGNESEYEDIDDLLTFFIKVLEQKNYYNDISL